MANNKPGADNVRYEVITQEDPDTGDMIVPLPEVLLKSMGWREGDEIDIQVGQDGKIYLKKK